MKTSFFGSFNTALRSMQNSQYALTVHSTNIANANDPSFTKRTLMTTAEARNSGPGILRLRDAFVDGQYRGASNMLGEAEVRRDVMSKVEDIFGDPVTGGLRQSIDRLFDGWQGVAESPSDGVSRLQVISAGRSFAEQIRSTYRQLDSVEQSLNDQLSTQVNDVNTALEKVFELNKEIAQLQRVGQDASALLDQRDAALDQLATLTGATAKEEADGTVRVSVGPTPVVNGPTMAKLVLVDGPNGPQPTWNVYNNPTYAGQGSIGGLVAVRDSDLAQLKQEIDALGRTVADRINQVHEAGTGLDGTTGTPFFVIGPGPANIVVNPGLQPQGVAAGLSGSPSDGENARQLAALADTPMLDSVVIAGPSQSPRTFYRNVVGWIGSRAQEANQMHEMAQTHVRVNEQQRQSAFGVSMDEEVANLTMQQKAFAAAARVVTIMDEMLDALINRTGH